MDMSSWTWDCLRELCGQPVTSGLHHPNRRDCTSLSGKLRGYSAEQVKKGERLFDSASYTAPSVSENLNLEQNAARTNLGGNWRMPTKRQFTELIGNCDVTWTNDYNGTGVAGKVFTSKINGNSVVFPAAGYCDKSYVDNVGSYGYYWSASWYDSSNAWYLDFGSRDQDLDYYNRYFGQSVRGVCE